VLEKTGDYHRINSVMHEIDLFDTLTFTQSGDTIVQSQFKDDIILKTIMKVRELFHLDEGIFVQIKKNIPVAAGLGGGSSDAACTLLALNKIWNLNLKEKELINIAAELGSDVPFFIKGGSCFVSGIGEVVEKITLPQMNLLLVNPGFEISTKEAYATLDKRGYEKTFSSLKLKEAKSVKEISSSLHNDFIRIQKQEVTDIVNELTKLGASASITGKGPTVFGIFETEEKVVGAYERIKDKYRVVLKVKTR
jgi:4-diphosphocytidyl-2-C-methyl-D-erythritol kinase